MEAVLSVTFFRFYSEKNTVKIVVSEILASEGSEKLIYHIPRSISIRKSNASVFKISIMLLPFDRMLLNKNNKYVYLEKQILGLPLLLFRFYQIICSGHIISRNATNLLP